MYQRVTAQMPVIAQRDYARAELALRVDQRDEARSAVAQALALDPDLRPAQLLALRLHLQAGEMAPAERLMRDMHVATPKDLELRLNLGSMLLEFEQIGLAREEFGRALKIDPDNVGALYALALIEMDSGHPEAAEKHLKALLEEGTRRADAQYYLGRIAEQRGQGLQAMAHYRQVNEGPRLLDASIRIAVLIGVQGHVEAARQHLSNLRERFPQQELRLLQIEGELLFQLRQDAEAEQVFDAALDRYTDDPDLLYGRAIVRERLGRMPEAEADLRRILAMHPDDARSLNALGYMLSNHSDRYTEAQAYVERALALSPDDPAIIDSLGWLRFRQGDLVQARAYLERAYAALKDPEVAAHLGEVLWLQGERARAREIWSQALEKDPAHPVLRETMQRLDGRADLQI